MFKITTALAHCDIPCKIYDPMLAQVAALSVARVTDLILEIDPGKNSLENQNQMARLVAEKEAQGRIVKSEVNVIWGDYFKAPQISNFPEIHEVVHSVMQAGSKCKQGVDKAGADALVEAVNKFAAIFWETKGIPTKIVIAPYPPALPIVQPILEDA